MGLAGIFLLFLILLESNHNAVLYASDESFPTVSIQQYSRLQLDRDKVFIALSNTGSFLAEKNFSSEKVYFNTPVDKVIDQRNNSFITNTQLPTYTDIELLVNNNYLDNRIPSSEIWWVDDIGTINDLKSARVVTERNSLNEQVYASPLDNTMVWEGYLPIENKLTSMPLYGNNGAYTTVGGVGTEYELGTLFTIPLCQAIVINNEIQPCSEENPSSDYFWTNNHRFLLVELELEPDTKTLITKSKDTFEPGDLVAVGELKWTDSKYPAGASLMVVGGDESITVNRRVFSSNINMITWAGNGVNNAGSYKGTSYYDDPISSKQKAYQRPLIHINDSSIKYVSKIGDASTLNSFGVPQTAMTEGNIYIPHITDNLLMINGLRESENSNVAVDVSARTIKISKDVNTINIPVNTTSFHTGYERYISVMGENSSNQTVYGKIGKLDAENGTVSFNISSFINVNELGAKKEIQLYAEDIKADGTSYISEAFTVTLEIVEGLSIETSPNTGLKYGTNVNLGDTVATYTAKNGTEPITFTLISDTSVSSHENDYQLFSFNNGNVVVNDPNGLDAGDYYFKINAIDANGYPVGGVESETLHISVAQITPTIVFDLPSITKKSIIEAAKPWNETATATPNTGTKIVYSISGGDAYLIDIDKDSGKITYKGNGGFGKVKIKATADDDPSSGKDNYEAAFTEKEIVIYREIDGIVTPHSNSSNTTTPTFAASDSNVKINGTIGTIKGTLGTPDTIGETTTTYKYALKEDGDAGLFQLEENAEDNTALIKTTANLGVKSYHITVMVSDSWSTKEIPVTINVGVAAPENLQFYETTAAINMITQKSVKITDTGVSVYATVKGSMNNNPVTYKIKDGSTNIITINPNTGAVTMHGVGTVTIVAEKKGATGQGDAQAELTFTVTAGAQGFIYTDNAGNELPKAGSIYNAYVQSYAPSKNFQLYTAGNPTGSTVTYQLKTGSPTDVISVDASGLVTILNASQNSQMGKVIVQATSHDPSGNYSDKTIELPINIDKGTRVITFAENPIYVVNGKGKVEPVIEIDGVVDTSGDILIEVDSNEDHTIAWTNDNKVIDYNYSGETGKDIKIHATKPMDRNYKVAEADGTIHIMGPDENVLAITSPGQIIYGDHFTIKSTQYDADSTNVQYTFEIDDTTYISNPTVNGNKAEFDALKYSGSKKTTITVTRTADGESPLSKKVQVTVLPKPIEITIDDQEKYKGEPNPSLTYQDFKNQLVTWNGTQDVIQVNDIKLSTTAKTSSNAGCYPIKGDSTTLNKTYPNYSFTFKEGTLTIKEDNIEDDWYHLEINDGNNTAYTGKWTNQDVNIISDHNEYKNMSLDQSTWKPNQVTVTKEGETNQSFWMKKDSGAITKEKKEIIKIDKTPPKVKGIKAKDTNNKLQDIINKLSGGIFFKPGTSFEITTSDAKGDLKVSGTKEISYKVFKIVDGAEEEIKNGTLTVTKEKASITISETVGKYKVCVIPTDNAENTNKESCHEVELKKIDVDVDKDGKPDFNDPDGDGCPDLNIKWKDPNDESKWIALNEDRNNDGIPELNIDANGDGKPDINVDLDEDGKPDLNIVTNIKWNPTLCVTDQIEEYCTDSTLIPDVNIDLDGDGRPDINVDLDDDGIPDINIDTDGDGKPDINIDTNKDGKPDENIKDVTEWNPSDSFTVNGVTFKTMTGLEPDTEEPTDTDKPTNPVKQGNDTDVKGSYYPGNSIGGAMTGDDTNSMIYIGLMISTIFIGFMLYQHKQKFLK